MGTDGEWQPGPTGPPCHGPRGQLRVVGSEPREGVSFAAQGHRSHRQAQEEAALVLRDLLKLICAGDACGKQDKSPPTPRFSLCEVRTRAWALGAGRGARGSAALPPACSPGRDALGARMGPCPPPGPTGLTTTWRLQRREGGRGEALVSWPCRG